MDQPAACPCMRPTTGWLSSIGTEAGQKQATIVDELKATNAAAVTIGAGVDSHQYCSPALQEKSVRKSETETFRYIIVVMCPNDISGKPTFWKNESLRPEPSARWSNNSDEAQATAACVRLCAFVCARVCVCVCV